MKKILVVVWMVLFLATFVSVERATAADRFVNNNDGTVTDTQTGLMWADHDNGSNINWFSAKSYCEGYSGGGKSGWRMPTVDELWNLYTNKANRSMITFTEQYVWASETRLTKFVTVAAYIDFRFGKVGEYSQSLNVDHRALPVRSGK